MGESGVILLLRVFVGLIRIIRDFQIIRLIFFLTALFVVEEWLNLFTLLNTGLSRQFYSELLQKIGHNSF